jgi:hypothetical protein
MKVSPEKHSAESERPSDEDLVLGPVSATTVLALLAAFVGFLDVREHDRAAQLWDLPALILGDTHVHGPMSLDRLASWLRDIDGGAVPGMPPSFAVPVGETAPGSDEPLIQRLDWISMRVAMVHARWPSRPRGGLLDGVSGTTFLIRIDQRGQAKIRGLLLRSNPAH